MRCRSLIIIGLLYFLCVYSLNAQTTNIMTYNIRYATDNDLENSWENRKEAMATLLSHYQPELFGIQEGLHHQLEYLIANLPNYSYIGIGRDDGKALGEYCAIFFDTTVYSVDSSNTFWLSETPEKVSLGWGANYHRVCTYGFFTHKESGREILIMNTHFDHQSELAREQSAKLILQKIEQINNKHLPVVLMGDFNANPETLSISIIRGKMNDAFEISKTPHYGPTGTFTGFDANKVIDNRIDYVFVKGFEVKSIVHIDDRRNDNFFVSDHLPVLVELNF
ncbi:MAG TPA: endonuclease/exonuclease/phosphatase family protein [Prolixibacteraceae bacterium]|nr:endonuclease/exonuclease/phosphatase family protein [Prolixibacteraceae bacterium]